ncbi:hypothetical protein [Vibrio sp.]|uniref:hypothetical protein n=1 Tax=Vibrio sp. TaxID=678 RepID=UPI00311DE43C
MNMSKSQEELINAIMEDDTVSFSEFQLAREEADARFEVLTEEFGTNNDISAFQKSADVTVQLMQNAVIDVKKAKLSDLGEAIAKDAIKAQINYIQLATKLFLDKL